VKWQVIGEHVMGDVLELLAVTQADRELFQEELQRSERQNFEAFMQQSAAVDTARDDSLASLKVMLGGNDGLVTATMEKSLQTETAQRVALQKKIESKDGELAKVKADAVARDNSSQRQVLALKQQVKRLTSRVTRSQDVASVTEALEADAPAAPTQRERAEEIMAQPKPRRKTNQPLWQSLATQEVLEASRPPEDFPIPGRHRGLVSEVDALQSKVKELEASMGAMRRENDKLRKVNDGHQRDGHQQLQEARDKLRQQEPQLTGAMRRVQWLVEQKKELETNAAASVFYTQKLEAKLIEKDEEVQRMRKKLQNPNNLKAKKGGFSYWRDVTSPAPSPEQPRDVLQPRQAAKLAEFSPEPVEPSSVVDVAKAAPCVESA